MVERARNFHSGDRCLGQMQKYKVSSSSLRKYFNYVKYIMCNKKK